ncbi:Copper chaperone CopZ [Abditibacterium utsteinense]|uniref:Copper chaperone CopZ n=1 Tax=Abditibacterium utsteinense TaxID=1960156 RepID=A0A2S8SS87_9BACT|nr:heavy metal-associated domain-containing protein [Abditibacterium utsteinense]PQV63599.1 Copper chaperone CopZ [Abditibacterium utsteinense]
MQTIELQISGMTCSSCVSHVTRALQSTPGVQVATVDLASGRAHVQGENLNESTLIEAVDEEGYGAQPIEPPLEGVGVAASNSIS